MDPCVIAASLPVDTLMIAVLQRILTLPKNKDVIPMAMLD